LSPRIAAHAPAVPQGLARLARTPGVACRAAARPADAAALARRLPCKEVNNPIARSPT
jgi:hypothetical protein